MDTSPPTSDLTPILLSKLKRYDSGRHALIAGEGTLKHVAPEDAPVLREMRGFRTTAEIAAALGTTEESVRETYERYAGDQFLVPLHRWNKLHWNQREHLYVNELDAALRDPSLVQVPLSPPCDPWFCTGVERDWLRGLIERRLGRALPPDTLLLANNGLSDGVFFWEVVAHGRVVMRIDFTGEREEEWTIGYTSAFEEVDWSFSVTGDETEERDRHIRANAAALDRLALDSVMLIEEICSRDLGLPLLYFSGGKESIVTMHLFKRAGVKAQLLFAGVGMDFPEDEAFIEQLAGFLRGPEYRDLFQLHIEPGDQALARQLLETEGKLEPSNMWCRSKLKYPIRNGAVERLYPDGVPIAFEGSRWYENDFRRSHPRVNFVTGIEGYRNSQQIWAHAVADWNGFDIWSYIHTYDLPVNPLYGLGYQRTTCWSCPLVNPFHIDQSRRQHPELWSTIDGSRLVGFERAELPLLPTETPF
ncbi:phosphoadenosine phosphosulfate reductase family protein [Microbispora amethystogenes]|uniref:Phosphoadenosine phosphosulphate reductase domain-containing protein n=1 Tax=Microbispora amethystogenes TaxID=1427754 RepID=A0ABQ4FPG2_9ACTN|nr:phosphoadenosine phosphosulfate reductase family protein [Microbispora amethystogenes]GIH36705.1 hypothetical protein Mam01_68690 [Microbispora amethystogenes]